MSALRFETAYYAGTDHGGEYKLKLVILYTVTPGRMPTFHEPGYGDAVEIQSFRLFNEHGVARYLPADQEDWIERDEALHEAMLTHWREMAEAAADDAADARREDRLVMARAT
jgi:hypothetical protein